MLLLRALFADDDWEYKNNEGIVCAHCTKTSYAANCIIAHNLHRPIAIRDVKMLVQRLKDFGCGRKLDSSVAVVKSGLMVLRMRKRSPPRGRGE